MKITAHRQVTMDGMMIFGRMENELRTLQFECCEDVDGEPFKGTFYVQGMRDGNVYMQQRPKRVRNKAVFRDDNCSLSHGKDGRWYFCFTMGDDRIGELPEQLVKQAGRMAQRVIREIIYKA